MFVQAGGYVWVHCEVKPGPFPDERLISVPSTTGQWLGFVPISSLKEPIEEGKTEIRALVIDVIDNKYRVKLPGEAITSSLLEASSVGMSSV